MRKILIKTFLFGIFLSKAEVYIAYRYSNKGSKYNTAKPDVFKLLQEENWA
jgi:hypothetical protein